MKTVKTTKQETNLKKTEIKMKNIETKLEYITDQNKILSRNLRKVFKIWDGAFKTIGAGISTAASIFVTIFVRNTYYSSQPLSFSGAIFLMILFVAVLGLANLLAWMLINTFLTRKIQALTTGGEENE